MQLFAIAKTILLTKIKTYLGKQYNTANYRQLKLRRRIFVKKLKLGNLMISTKSIIGIESIISTASIIRSKSVYIIINNNKKIYFRIRNRKGGQLKGYLTLPCHNMVGL